MWDFYKELFATVQLATITIGWTIYQATFERLGPAAVFFVSMQAGAMFASVWAGKLEKRKAHALAADDFVITRAESCASRTT